MPPTGTGSDTPPPPTPDALRAFVLGRMDDADAEAVGRWLDTHPGAADTLAGVAADDPLTEALRAGGRLPRPAGDEVERTIAGVVAAAPTDPPVPPDGPRRIGGYEVLGALGRGGMGVVYAARDPNLDRTVAVKVMHPALVADPVARARFVAEAKAAARVAHDHIVPVYQVGEDEGVPFLAMPALPGETLEQRLGGGPLPVAEVLRLGAEVAAGLAAAHAAGLVHRDVKPSNIWLEASPGGGPPRARVLDFGLARGAGADDLTRVGGVVGTPDYIAPEQARGQRVDGRADLFSLGAVLYRTATGRRPFPGAGLMATLTGIAIDTPPRADAVNPAVPAPLAALIARLLEKDPARRPASAADVASELRRIAAAPPRPPRRTLPRVAAGLAGVAAVVAAGVFLRLRTEAGELVIEADSPDIEVTVRQGDVVLADRGKGRSFVLRPGTRGTVEFRDPDSGAAAVTKEFTVTRGGKTVVRVAAADLGPAAAPAAAGPSPAAQRAALEWVLARGGYLSVWDDAGDRTVRAGDRLGTYRGVAEVNLSDAVLPPELPAPLTDLPPIRGGFVGPRGWATDDLVARLARVPALRDADTFVAHGCPRLTDAGLATLAEFPRLVNLDLLGSGVRGPGLDALARAGRVRMLTLAFGQVRGAELVRLRGLPLAYLNLQAAPGVDDDALDVLADGRDGPFDLLVSDTRVTADGVKRFASAVPGAKVVWNGGTVYGAKRPKD